MNSFLAPLLSFLLLYRYVAIFVVVFASSLAIPLPINSLLLATGAFASQGHFSLVFSFIIATGANVLGDLVVFLLARQYGHDVLRLLHIRIPKHLVRLEDYVRDHAAPTIFFTRFTGIAGAIAGVFSGFVGVAPLLFLLWSFLGNAVSDGGMLYAGYFFGNNWTDFSNFFSVTQWVVLAGLAAIATGITFWYRDHHRRRSR